MKGIKYSVAALFIVFNAIVISAHCLGGDQEFGVPTREEVEQELVALQAQTQYSPAIVDKLKITYGKILESLTDKDEFSVKAASFENLRLTADKRIAEFTAELDRYQRLAAGPVNSLPNTATVDKLESLLAKELEALTVINSEISKIDEQLNDSSSSVLSIRQRLSEIKTERDQLAAEQSYPKSKDENDMLNKANEWLFASQILALDSESDMLESKTTALPVQSRLLVAERALQVAKQSEQSKKVNLLRERIKERRKSEAEDSVNDTQALSKNGKALSTEVAAYIEENQSLGLELTQLAENLNEKSVRSLQVKKQLDYINDRLLSVKQRLEIVGLTESLGHLLVEIRNELPNSNVFRIEHDKLLIEMSNVALRKLELQGEFNKKNETVSDKAVLLNSLATHATKENTRLVSELVENRLDLLKNLTANNATYMRMLSDFDFDLLELIKTTHQFDDFLMRKLMWVRTASPIYTFTAENAFNELFTIGKYYKNIDYQNVLIGHLKMPWLWPLVFLLVAIFAARSWIKQLQIKILQKITLVSYSTLRPAIEYLLLTIIQSLPIGLLAFIFSSLVDVASIPITHEALVKKLWLYLLGIDFICRLIIPNGFAHKYFHWPERLVHDMHKGFIRLRNIVIVPLLLVTMMPWNLFASKDYGFVGTVAVAILMCCLAVTNRYFLSVPYSIVGSIVKRQLVHPVSKLQKVVKIFMIFGPIAWAIALLIGYRYASLMLSSCVFETIIAIPFIILTFQLAERGLAEFQNRVKFRREYAEQTAQGSANTTEISNSESSSTVAIEENKNQNRSIEELAEETEKLLSFVFVFIAIGVIGYIWYTVLPALAIFDDVVLWKSTSLVGGQETEVSVSLKDFIFMLVGSYVAYVAARKLPAFVEMVLLSRINLSNGSRYAITTLMSYALVGFAVSYIAKSIGFGWDKIQWAVAALSVGIGFGLQEIVANFISGIIILFERPIRVGDLVTINGQTGVVHRIQIRATTLRDFDNKELLVPNKEFITSSLLNWTLTDKEVRILLPVGIAYGSDVDKALELLELAALEHPQVMDIPAPMVTFEAFGDNSLSLFLRCRIASVDDRLQIVTDLHKAINAKYNQAGISIAFPQRDVHVDFAAPLEVLFKKPAAKSV